MSQGVARWCAVFAAGILLNGLGCAKAPSGAGSGVRLVVTMRVNSPNGVKDNYHYFFLIRNLGDDLGQNGPIPVTNPPYGGNGFAFGKNNATAPFTDFVQYSRDQEVVRPSGYTLYHAQQTIAGQPNVRFFLPRGEPAFTVSPNGGSVLQFELDLAQIQPDAGELPLNPDNRPRYLQVNFITTSKLPVNSSIIDQDFFTDAMGDQSSSVLSESFNTYLTIDTSQIGKTYSSTLSPGPEEPTGDTWRSDVDPALDIVFWSVQIVGR